VYTSDVHVLCIALFSFTAARVSNKLTYLLTNLVTYIHTSTNDFLIFAAFLLLEDIDTNFSSVILE